MISTRIHGLLDYGVGLILIVAPYVLGFADGTAAQYVPQALGVAAIGMALLTDYERGVVRVIPMRMHIAIDILSGSLLLASPFLFGFADRVMWPHILFGALEIGAGILTSPTPGVRAAVTPTATTTRGI